LKLNPNPGNVKTILYVGGTNEYHTVSHARNNISSINALKFDGIVVVDNDTSWHQSGYLNGTSSVSLSMQRSRLALNVSKEKFLLLSQASPNVFSPSVVTAVANHYGVLAQALLAEGYKGVAWDSENNNGYWNVSDYPGKTRQEVFDAWYALGFAVGQKIEQYFPALAFFSFHGSYIGVSEEDFSGGAPRNDFLRALGGWSYGTTYRFDTAGGFFNGLLAGRSSGLTIDGGELYDLRTSAADFAHSSAWRKGTITGGTDILDGGNFAVPASLRPSYSSKVSIGYMSYSRRWKGITPSIFKSQFQNGINNAEHYAMVYTSSEAGETRPYYTGYQDEWTAEWNAVLG
jgi:hypothetical protein